MKNLIFQRKNKYRNNVGKLAAWLSASHIEKASKKSAP